MTSRLARNSALSEAGKGTSFTRAILDPRTARLSASEVGFLVFEGMFPQGPKPILVLGSCGTAEGVPFPNPSSWAQSSRTFPHEESHE